MKTWGIAAIGCAVVFAAASLAPAADEKVLIKPKFTPGSYTMVTTVETDASVIVGDKEAPRGTTDMMMMMDMTISKPDEKGFKEISLKYTHVRQVAGSSAGTMEYDSNSPNESPDSDRMGMFLKPLLSSTLVAVVDPNDEIVQVKGLEDMYAQMAKSAGKAGEAMKGMFSEQTIKDLLSAGKRYLPVKPVGSGDSYQTKTTLDLPFIGLATLAVDGKVVSIRKVGPDTVVTIDLTAGMTNEKKSTTQMGNRELTLEKIETRQKGQMEFDVDMGMATRQSLTQSMIMEMSMPAPVTDENKPLMTTTTKQTSRITTVFGPKGTVKEPTTFPASRPATMPAASAPAK